MKTTREAEREAAEDSNPHADLIAWLNAESDRLDDAAAGDELAAEGLEVSSEGIELLRRRAELLSLAAEILETGDAEIPPGAAAVGAQLRDLAAGETANRAKLLRAAEAVELTPPPWPDDLAVAIPAGDPRVRLGSLGRPPLVAVRVLSEASYQHALRCVNAMERLPGELDGFSASAREQRQPGEAEAYRHAAELVRQAREGR